MSASPSPAGVGGTSLAMLVQQRELQNSRKLETLVMKNDELAEACRNAEQEREALLERLGYLDTRITETCTGLVTFRRECDGRINEHTSRLTYLEQGVEERFKLLEAKVETPVDNKYVEGLVSETVQRAMRPLQKQIAEKDETINLLALQLRAVAGKVGGYALQEELRSVTTEFTEELETLEEKTEKAINQKCFNIQDKLQQLTNTCGDLTSKVSQLDSKCSGLTHRMESTEQNQTSGIEQRTTAEGRLNQLEAGISHIQEKIIQAVAASSSGATRLELLESKVGVTDGKILALEADAKGVSTSVGVLTEQLTASTTTVAQNVDNMKDELLNLANDVEVMEEKRRKREAQQTEPGTQLAELDRLDLIDIRKDIELLKDNSPIIDEARILALVSELDRGKDVLESIIKMHEAKTLQRSDDLDRRVHQLEHSALERREPAVPAPVVSNSALRLSAIEELAMPSPGLSVALPQQESKPSRTVSPGRRNDDMLKMPILTTAAAERSVSGGSGSKEALSRGPSPSRVTGGSGAVAEGMGTIRAMQQLLEQSTTPVVDKSVPLDFEESIKKQEEWRSTFLTTQQEAPPPPPMNMQHYEMRRSVSPAFTRHDDVSVAAEVKSQMEEKLDRSKEVMEERRRLESELEKVNQQLSFIQMAFQTLSEKESKHALISQLESDGSEKADNVKGKLLKVVEDIRKSKHNIYERERVLVEEGSRLRKRIGELRETEKELAEELHSLQKMLAAHLPRGTGVTPSIAPTPAPKMPSMPPAYIPRPRGDYRDTSPTRSTSRSPNVRPLF
eukprot:TRINITY_DN33960_c0_g1_i1.p1 TRINITY_DN33960_c0_g1~~TRINITY_DN33960_c0_g1_i1.p1  ORF type:complete len:792 (+),score=238.94 TRINITY_DN33960_c0_g1_i1:43-2418(+)